MHACIETVARRGCAAATRPPLTVSNRLPAGSHPKAPANRQLVSARVAFADTSSLVSAEPPTVQKKYILGELLGSGTAGQVHVGTESQSGLQYAVKVLPKRKGSKDRTKVIRSEVNIEPSRWDYVTILARDALCSWYKQFFDLSSLVSLLQIDISRRLRNCRHAVKMMDHFEVIFFHACHRTLLQAARLLCTTIKRLLACVVLQSWGGPAWASGSGLQGIKHVALTACTSQAFLLLSSLVQRYLLTTWCLSCLSTQIHCQSWSVQPTFHHARVLPLYCFCRMIRTSM